MPSPRMQHPFRWEKPSFLWNLTNPSTVGSVVAAVAAAFPKKNISALDALFDKLPGGEITSRFLLSLLGFLVGYGSCKGCDWLRTKALRSLLAYHGWVTHPKSARTKLWGIVVSILRGRKPFSTFKFQRLIPKQPLPTLNDTLDRWLAVAENLVSRDEFELTKEVVEDFRKHEGPKIQVYLEKRARETDSWIHDYWLMGAYLSSRQPLPLHSNYYVTHGHETPLEPTARMAGLTHTMTRFEKLLSEEKLPPVLLQNLVPLCMHGFSYLFNSNRIPGEYIDELVRYPGHSHVIVIRNGNYFKLDVYHTDENGRKTQLTPHELQIQFQKIIKEADALEKPLPVAALTAQNRSIWAKQRKVLLERNGEIMKDIDTAMFVLTFEDHEPEDYAAYAKCVFTGDGTNRWFDKCFSYTEMGSGYVGGNVEHSGIDAMVYITLQEYAITQEEYENKDVVKKDVPRNLPNPQMLKWDLTGMEENINKAAAEYKSMAEDLTLHVYQPNYGKGFMKKQRISPDGYIQMSLQLAFYRMNKHIPKTYEPSTGRLFLLGRTETVHPASQDSIAWVKAMDDPLVDLKVKTDLLRKSVIHQSKYRLQATIGQGCDRHLVAMLCASRELGMDLPKIFAEKTWQMPWILSTSQTPNMFYDYGCKLNFPSCSGGFGPADADGYGLSYTIFGDDLINMHITSWKSSKTANAVEFARHIEVAFDDMKKLFSK